MIGYLTKGGVSYGETDQMTPYERRIALDTIRSFLEESNRKQQEAINNAKISNQNSAPKTLMTK